MRALVGAQWRQVAPVEPDRAAEVTRNADDRVDQRRLAHPVAPE
jgi:hypothetical protein